VRELAENADAHEEGDNCRQEAEDTEECQDESTGGASVEFASAHLEEGVLDTLLNVGWWRGRLSSGPWGTQTGSRGYGRGGISSYGARASIGGAAVVFLPTFRVVGDLAGGADDDFLAWLDREAAVGTYLSDVLGGGRLRAGAGSGRCGSRLVAVQFYVNVGRA